MLLLIDNFDSFTYNIVQAYQQLGQKVIVFRNNAITLEKIEQLAPKLLILGPGPGAPKDSGISRECIALASKNIPLFGICLGHQIIGEAFGGKITRAPEAVHGKTSKIFHSGHVLFDNLPQRFVATRYHSLVIAQNTLPNCLELTAWTEEGVIMGIQHKTLPIAGVQFHPESAASEGGLFLLNNSLKFIKS